MLGDQDSKEKIQAGEIVLVEPGGRSVIDTVAGHERSQGQLQAHGYDLRPEAIQDWSGSDWHRLQQGKDYPLMPRSFVVVRTHERVQASNNAAATISAMARKTLLGLTHVSTTVHPGWAASEEDPEPFFVAVANPSRAPITLSSGEGFCRSVFFETKTPATLPPPSIQSVRAGMDEAMFILRKRFGKRAKITGWALIFLCVILAGAILYFIQPANPGLLGIGIPHKCSFFTRAVNTNSPPLNRSSTSVSCDGVMEASDAQGIYLRGSK